MAGVCTFIAGSDVGTSANREYYHFCITGVPESSCPAAANNGVPVGTYYPGASDCRSINDGHSYTSQCIGNDWQRITSTGKILSDRSTPEVALNERGDLIPSPIVLQCKRVEETCCPPDGVDTGFCQCSRSFPGGTGKITCKSSQDCSGGATCSLSTAPDVDCPKGGPGAGQECFCATTCSGHCPANSICQAGVCAGLSPSGGSACGTGTPCPSEDETCQDGQCYAAQGACTDRGAAAPCRLGFLCDDGKQCIKGCQESSDCPNGADGTADTPLCYSTMCVPEECAQDVQCAGSKFGDKNTCSKAGVCVQICGAPEDKACPAGQACSHHKPTMCGKICTTSDQCGDYEFCDKASLTASSGVCVRGCRANIDCRLGYACWQDGKCYPACKTTSDCGKTEVCVDGACVFDPDPGSDSKSLWILWIVLAGVAFGVIVAIIVRMSRRHKALSTAQSMAEAQSSNS